jgi:type VI secretion system secreted protein Hcp
MSFDAFVNFGDIKGESTDSDHKDWVMMFGYRQSVDHPSVEVMPGTAGQSRTGVTHSEFTITKYVDAASPKLFEACCNGKHFNEVVIDLVRKGSKPVKYLEIKLQDCLITGITYDTRTTTEPPSPEELIHLTFGKIEFTYTRQKPDGSIGESVSGKWDLKQNRAE